jgi:hypothetical protein
MQSRFYLSAGVQLTTYFAPLDDSMDRVDILEEWLFALSTELEDDAEPLPSYLIVFPLYNSR